MSTTNDKCQAEVHFPRGGGGGPGYTWEYSWWGQACGGGVPPGSPNTDLDSLKSPFPVSAG